MRSTPLVILACALSLGCGPKPAWHVKGAGLKSLVGKDMMRSCRDGQAEDCYALADRLEQVNANTPEQRQARYHLHLQACQQGHAGACYRLGYDHVYGEGPNLAPDLSHDALVAACESGQPGPCHVAGASLAEGKLGMTFELRAFEIFLKGCDLDEPKCCAWAGLMLEFGRGPKQDRGKAFPFFDKACELGQDEIGCFNVAMHLLERPEEEQDLAHIAALMQRSCDVGNKTACENVEILEAQAAEAEAEVGAEVEKEGTKP